MDAVTITSLASFFSDETKSLQRGENHFRSDHVETFTYLPGELRGVVRASMKDKSCNVVEYLDEKNIKTTTCECPRGDYKCSHAAALIIFGIHNISRTDVECQWKKKKGSTVVRSVDDMYPSKDYNPLKRNVTDDDRMWLRNQLKTCGQFTGMYWLLTPEPDKQSLPVPSVEELILSEEFVDSQLDVEFLLSKLKLTDDQLLAVQLATKGQRNNPVWHKMRKGRLTASNFGAVLKAKRVTPSLMKRLMGNYDLSGVHAVNWGIIQEDEAVKQFSVATKCEVKESGIWLSHSGVLGASPDGLVGDDAIIEVKCPYTQRASTIAEAVMSKDFYITKSELGSYELKKDVYWHQIQGQLYLTNRKLCYFIFWTLMETLILQITRDELWAENIKFLEKFHRDHIIPKLLAGKDRDP